MTSGGPYGQGKGFQVGEESLSRGKTPEGEIRCDGGSRYQGRGVKTQEFVFQLILPS